MSTDALASGWAKALGGDRKQFNMFIEKMLDGFAYHKIVVDKAGKPVDYVFLEVNHAFEKMTGLKRERIIGKKVTEVLVGIEKDPADWIGVYGRVALTGEPVEFENHAEPLGKWYRISAYCPEKGYFVALFEDISEHKKAEYELWQAKKDWERTFDSVPDFVAILDNQYRIVRVNRAMAQQLGVTPERAIGLFCYQCVHGLNNSPDFCPHAQTVKDGKEHQAEVHETRLGGDFLVSTTPLRDENGSMIGSVHVARNITERKKVEDSLREAREQTEFDKKRLETILETSPSAVVIIDAQSGKFSYVNKHAKQLYGFDTLGLSLEENVAKVKAKRANGSDYPIEEMPVSRTLNHGEEVYNEEMIIERADGKLLPIIASTTPLRDIKGNITAAIVVFEDITDRKKADEKIKEYQTNLEKLVEERTFSLKASEEKYRKLFDSIDEGFCIIEMVFDSNCKPLDYRFVEVNASFERQTGMHNANGKLMRSFAPNHEAYWFEIYGKVALTGESIRFTNEAKELNRYYDVFAFPVGEGKIWKVGILFNDISQRRNLEKQLKDAERLAAIGATAGMVGHDIRNPLQAIIGDLFLARTELATLPKNEQKVNALESLDEIEKNIDYINKIVQDLQDFARPLNPNPRDVDLQLIIEKLLQKNSLPENTIVSVKIEDEARKIVADADYLNRILYNLVTNAVQAMPQGGELAIRIYKEAKDIVITVKDTGVGIPEAVKGKLFTPMFTTKSKGQGFGLPVVKRMTESLGGAVTFESQEGKGTTFTISLPQKN
jgi:PAS domain S-box-containing protein